MRSVEKAEADSGTGASVPAASGGFAGLIDAILFLGVLGFSAVAVLALAFVAPFALAISAISGVFAPARHRGGWHVTDAPI